MKRDNLEASLRIENGNEILLNFSKFKEICSIENILPVIVQNYDTREVLFLAYTNPEALRKSLEIKKAVFFSTSRRAIWIKGETSGNYLELIEIRINCEQNSLLYLVKPINKGVCHTRKKNKDEHRETCYYRKIVNDHLEFLPEYL